MARPILYSFRRCPYAIRARLAIASAGVEVELREVMLRDKPQAMLDASPKGTVPVLVLSDGRVLEESLDIMHWALHQRDPERWLDGRDACGLITACETKFKPDLDRYKYATRFEGTDPVEARGRASLFIATLERALSDTAFLSGARAGLADYAILPFIRQFAQTDRVWFDAQAWSRVPTWLADFTASSRFEQAMTKHTPWKQGDPGVSFGGI